MVYERAFQTDNCCTIHRTFKFIDLRKEEMKCFIISFFYLNFFIGTESWRFLPCKILCRDESQSIFINKYSVYVNINVFIKYLV